MKNLKNKRGISLIVLVITIIVMIILAAAIILAISNSGIISKANEANDAYKSKTMQERLEYLKAEATLENKELDFDNLEVKEYILENQMGEYDITSDGEIIKVFKTGTPVEPNNDGTTYYITKTEELMWIRDEVNAGDSFSGKIVKLMNNINLGGYVTTSGVNGISWEPIASTDDITDMEIKSDTNTGAFLGTIDGNGKTITGMCIKEYNGLFCGLVGKLGETGVIKNLNVSGIYIEGNSSNYLISGITALSSGTIQNCNVKGKIVASNYSGDDYSSTVGVAGVVSYATSAKIENCSSYVEIKATSHFAYTQTNYITSITGGVVAASIGNTVVSNCANYGKITIDVPEKLETFPSNYAGGVVAFSTQNAKVIGCYNKGNIDMYGYGRFAIGGIVARSEESNPVENCYNTGTLDVSNLLEGATYSLGGIEGHNQGKTVKNCYSVGKIVKSTLNTEKCYAGMIVGYNNTATVTGAYYLTETLNAFGASSGTITSVRALSSQYMKSKEFITILNTLDNTQESSIIFKEDLKNVNDGYPILYWQ